MTCSCGGKVLTIYYRQGKPSKWIALGKMCIQCKTWEGQTPDTHQANTTPDQRTATADGPGAPDFLDVQNPPENTAPPVDEDKARAFREKWRK